LDIRFCENLKGNQNVNTKRTRPSLLLLLAWVATAAVQAQASNLVSNGGFETGDFTSWTLSGINAPASVDNGTYGLYSQISPHSGNYDADFESDGGAGYQYLSQTLSTTAGASYLLSFWFDDAPLNFGDFLLTWNGDTLLDADGVGPVFSATNWTEMQFVVTATGSSAILQFGFGNMNSILALDDISVVPAQPGDGYGYVQNAGGATITITNYTGPGGALTVPTIINGYLVTGIGLANGETAVFPVSLTSITLPDSVASIGSFAFYLCTNLASAAIPNSVTNIGECAFSGCNRLTNALIPTNLGSLSEELFDECTNLPSVVIPNGVTNIGIAAFGYCYSLTHATIPASVTSLGTGAFGFCTSLTGVNIPNDVTNIGDYAFQYCNHLTNVTLGKSVTSIGISAFEGTAFTSLIIPGGVTNIGDDAFYGSILAGIYFAGNAPAVGSNLFEYDGNQATAYYLPGTTGWSAFSAATDVPSVLWEPVIQTGGGNFGVQNNQFGFTITNSTTTNIPIAVEACTNLANPVWTPLQFLTLTNSFHFSDPQWTNFPTRYYGIGFP
jgi:hypothetical protein